MGQTYDVIVVGVGGMGSATLYHLAKRGKKVLGLEQFDVPHEMGSSHGLTRIIRLAYYEDPSYVPLLRRAYQLWYQLEQEFGEQLFYQTGSLDIGVEASETFSGSLRSCEEHNLEHRVLTSEQMTQHYPGYRFPPATMAVFQPQGGLLVPEKCIQAHAHIAQHHGAALHTRERVQGWDVVVDGRVKVTTNQATYMTEKLVVCGGPWAYKLVPELAGKAVPERQVLIWLETKQPQWFVPQNFPVWNAQVDEGRYYGFPEFNPTGQTPGMKFGRWHHRDEICDPDTVDRDVHPEDEALLRDFAEKYFPDGAGKTLMMKTCMFTNTSDEHWILQTLPDMPQVAVAAGFSGHGFKMASVIGEIMADLAEDGQTRHDISLHQLARL
ncbi:MAG: N-methyl-L-tryptophan oxidase [Chloroflexi bacterium]|nr:MAG: N-methyl-L-tryptophan oxidase [Phototrophicales bacterium]RMF82724.1 MAG: N-methyl-L-tryptophan oxidase [Chloroflexota bacterium]